MNNSVRKIFACGTEEEKRIAFFEVYESFKSYDEDTRFSILMLLLTYYVTVSDTCMKNMYFEMVFEEYKTSRFRESYLELCGIVYKYVEENFRVKILKEVKSGYGQIVETTSGAIAGINFFKNIHRCLPDGEKLFFLDCLDTIRKKDNGALSDSFEYLFHNIQKSFHPSESADVLLVLPEFLSGSSFLQMPLGIATAMKALKDKGYLCEFLDNRVYSYNIDQLTKISSHYKYLVFVSTPIDQVQNYFLDYRYNLFCNTVKSISDALSNKHVIVCGAHGTVRPDLLVKDINADIIIVRGEFDYQIVDVIDGLREDNLLETPNIVTYFNGSIFYGCLNLEIMHPERWADETVPYEYFDVYDYYGYAYVGKVHVKKLRRAVVQSSRGCPFRCTFCYDFYDKRIRFKNINNVISELKMLKRMNIDDIFFIDQTFTLDKSYTIELCNRICSEKIGLEWVCETRVDLIDDEIAQAMSASGCKQVWLGIESLNQQVLDDNQKNYSVNKLIETIDILTRHHIDYCAFVMMGMVGETIDTIKNTVNEILSKRIKTTRSILTFTPRFGTTLYKESEFFRENPSIGFNGLFLLKGSIDNDVSYEELSYYTNLLIQNVRG